MKKSKIMSVLLAVAIVFSNAVFAVSANDGETAENYVYDSFSEGIGKWQIGAVKDDQEKLKPTLTVNDGILSVASSHGTPWNNASADGCFPNIYRLVKNGEGINAEVGKNVILKTKFRLEDTQGTNLRAMLKINRPLEVANQTGDRSGAFTVLQNNQGKVEYVNGSRSDNFPQTATATTGCIGNWVELKMVFKPSADGTVFEKADYYMTIDGANYTYIDQKLPTKDRTTGWSDWTAIRSVTFATAGDPTTLSIDYVKVYEESLMYAELVENEITVNDFVQIRFDENAVIDGDVNSITLKNSDGEIIETTGTWDNNVIKVKPNETPVAGTYSVDISGLSFAGETLILENNTVVIESIEQYIYDDFSEDAGKWKAGAVRDDKFLAPISVSNGILSVATNHGVIWNNASADGCFPNIYRLVKNGEGIKAEAGKNVILKTKFRLEDTQGSNLRAMLKINRPLEVVNQTGDRSGAFTVLQNNQGKVECVNGSRSDNFPQTVTATTGCIGNWVELKMVFKPSADGTVFEKADYYMTIDGADYTYIDQKLPTKDRTAGWSDWTAIRCVTFATAGDPTTLSIDYVKVYEESLMYAELVKNEINAGEAIQIQFNENAVIDGNINNVELKNESNENVETIKAWNGNILELTSEEGLTAGRYTIDISALTFLGEEIKLSNNVVSVLRVENYVYEDFNEGKDDWAVGAANSGYEASISVSDGILRMTDAGNIGQWNTGKGQAPNIYRLVNNGNGIKAKAGENVILETKFKVRNAEEGKNTRTYLKINRPNELSEVNVNDNAYGFYSVFVYNSGTAYYTNGSGGSNEPLTNNNIVASGCEDKWIELKIVFKPNGAGKVFEQVDYYVTIDGVTTSYLNKYLPTKDRKDNSFSDWTAIRNITFSTRQYSNITEIDYLKLYKESYTELFDGNGKGLKKLTENTTVYPRFIINPVDGKVKSYYVASAKYVGGKLEDTRIEKITTAGGMYVEENGYVLGDDISDVVIKTFIWEADTLKPVCDVKVFEEEKEVVYVATKENGGDDINGKGTLNAPYESISKAIAMASDVDGEIIVDGGNYYIDKTINVNSSKKKADKIC